LSTASDLLLPRTDGGVIVQAIVFAVILGGAFAAVRHEPEFRLFVIGIGVLGLAFFALRSLH
jgi:threonine dehydrogenase-like Zn-dependent dehydrogenase